MVNYAQKCAGNFGGKLELREKCDRGTEKRHNNSITQPTINAKIKVAVSVDKQCTCTLIRIYMEKYMYSV